MASISGSTAYSIGPRAESDMSPRQAWAWLEHSQTEDLKIYLAENNGGTQQNLEFTKALHCVGIRLEPGSPQV
jgi:hypothetical protein